jgi:hypothetical protein
MEIGLKMSQKYLKKRNKVAKSENHGKKMHVEINKHSPSKGINSQTLRCKFSMEIGLKMSQKHLKKRN